MFVTIDKLIDVLEKVRSRYGNMKIIANDEDNYPFHIREVYCFDNWLVLGANTACDYSKCEFYSKFK